MCKNLDRDIIACERVISEEENNKQESF